jgi:hypothetical protein
MSVATLSPKRESFAHHYSASHNATAAAKAAGYSELRAGRTGYELLQRRDVAALVRELDAAKRAATGIDEPWIVERLQSLLHTGTAWRFRAICPSLSSTNPSRGVVVHNVVAPCQRCHTSPSRHRPAARHRRRQAIGRTGMEGSHRRTDDHRGCIKRKTRVWIEDFHGTFPQLDGPFTSIDTAAEGVLRWAYRPNSGGSDAGL